MKRVSLWVGVVLSLFYLLFILLLRGSDAWCLIREGSLNEVGGFLAGVFTPLAFLWLVIGYFLLGEQVELLRKQREDEYKRSLPRLKLEGDGVSNDEQAWEIQNNGAPARELKVLLDNSEQSLPNTILAADEKMIVFSIPYGEPACSFRCEARFTSVRQERLHQIWEIRRTGGTNPTFEPVKELTKGPTSLEEGQ